MEYESDFSKSFMMRTLAIVQGYGGDYDATLLINCLLGLLVLPREALLNKIPTAPLDSFDQWGLKPGSIRNSGKCDYDHKHELNLQQLVRRMRNAVAHFQVEPFPKKGDVEGFAFRDRNGFHAELTLLELKEFVVQISKHLTDAE